MESKNFFTDSSAVRFEYRVLVGGRFDGPWRELALDRPLAPRERRAVALPDEAAAARARPDAALRLRAVRIREANLVPAGWTVADEQLVLSAPASADAPSPSAASAAPPSPPVERDGVLTVGGWRFSRKTGVLVDGGMTLDALRYPVGGERNAYLGPGPNAIYRECLREGLLDPEPTCTVFTEPAGDADGWTFRTEQVWRGRMRADVTSVMRTGVTFEVLGPTTETNTAFRAVNVWHVRSDGSLDLDSTFTRLGRPLNGLSRHVWSRPTPWKEVPRLGWRFAWPVTGAVEYDGRGPWETYPGRTAGAFPAVWRVGSVREMGHAYTRCQDFGNRADVRRVTIEEAGFTVSARGKPIQAAVSPWRALELMLHDHSADLPEPKATYLTVHPMPDDAGRLRLRFRKTAASRR